MCVCLLRAGICLKHIVRISRAANTHEMHMCVGKHTLESREWVVVRIRRVLCVCRRIDFATKSRRCSRKCGDGARKSIIEEAADFTRSAFRRESALMLLFIDASGCKTGSRGEYFLRLGEHPSLCSLVVAGGKKRIGKPFHLLINILKNGKARYT
jgi:hypothetical protein